MCFASVAFVSTYSDDKDNDAGTDDADANDLFLFSCFTDEGDGDGE